MEFRRDCASLSGRLRMGGAWSLLSQVLPSPVRRAFCSTPSFRPGRLDYDPCRSRGGIDGSVRRHSCFRGHRRRRQFDDRPGDRGWSVGRLTTGRSTSSARGKDCLSRGRRASPRTPRGLAGQYSISYCANEQHERSPSDPYQRYGRGSGPKAFGPVLGVT